jgi:hypothetical protein
VRIRTPPFALCALLLCSSCEERVTIARGARGVLAHLGRCKIVAGDRGLLRVRGDGALDAPELGSARARCLRGREVELYALAVVEPDAFAILGPRRLARGARASYHLAAFDRDGERLWVGRVEWRHGPELRRLARCVGELCPDFPDSVLVQALRGPRARLAGRVGDRFLEREIEIR